MKQPDWLDKNGYRFTSHQIGIEGQKIHYLDEGEGKVVLFVHGTPTWSFEYRKVINLLQSRYRCVALDHLGFGLSDKPSGADYTPQGHAARLERFIDKLNLRKISLVAHDFGGPIALSVAIKRPGLFSDITVLNSWLWSLKGEKHFEQPSRLITSPFGKFLYQQVNFSAKILLKAGFSDKKKLTSELHRQYLIPQDKAARKAAYSFALALLGEGDWYESLWQNRSALENIPMQIVWGSDDKLLPAPILLNRWREGFPGAKVIELNGAGHSPQEELPDSVADAIGSFI